MHRYNYFLKTGKILEIISVKDVGFYCKTLIIRGLIPYLIQEKRIGRLISVYEE